jgi:hypothetical protein
MIPLELRNCFNWLEVNSDWNALSFWKEDFSTWHLNLTKHAKASYLCYQKEKVINENDIVMTSTNIRNRTP